MPPTCTVALAAQHHPQCWCGWAASPSREGSQRKYVTRHVTSNTSLVTRLIHIKSGCGQPASMSSKSRTLRISPLRPKAGQQVDHSRRTASLVPFRTPFCTPVGQWGRGIRLALPVNHDRAPRAGRRSGGMVRQNKKLAGQCRYDQYPCTCNPNFRVVSVAEKHIKRFGGHPKHVAHVSLSGEVTVLLYQHRIFHKINKRAVGLGCASFPWLLNN